MVLQLLAAIHYSNQCWPGYVLLMSISTVCHSDFAVLQIQSHFGDFVHHVSLYKCIQITHDDIRWCKFNFVGPMRQLSQQSLSLFIHTFVMEMSLHHFLWRLFVDLKWNCLRHQPRLATRSLLALIMAWSRSTINSHLGSNTKFNLA